MESKKITTKVNGMICPQCEDEIAHCLLYTRGVLSCGASYRRNEVAVEYDPGLINESRIAEVLSSIGYPVGNSCTGRYSDLIAAISVVILLFLIPLLTGLISIPEADSTTGYLSLFLIGTLTGVHCIGMCGGIMLTQRNVLIYNTGRLISYTTVGALCGMIGTSFSYDIPTKSMLLTLSGLLVVFTGLKMWGVPFLRAISPELMKPCQLKGRAFSVGLLTGIMPCGALSSMWIVAGSSGNYLTGAEDMLVFGLGTCVFMTLFGLFGIFIPKKYNKYLLKGSTVLIVALGLVLISKGMKLVL